MRFKIGDEVRVTTINGFGSNLDSDAEMKKEMEYIIGLTGTVIDIIDYDNNLPIGVEFMNEDFYWFSEDELEKVEEI